MAVKRCCVDTCTSSSTRQEDKGVTYHKFPKDPTLRDIWISVTNHRYVATELQKYVCSRHFCKDDFQLINKSKYVLKSDAVPSIFPWVIIYSDEEMEALKPTKNPTNEEKVPKEEPEADESKTINVNDEDINLNDDNINVNDNNKNVNDNNINVNDSNTKLTDFNIEPTKDSDIENVEAIKKYIAQQEKEIEELKAEQLKSKLPVTKEDTAMSSNPEQSLSVSSSVIDNMMIESELDSAKKEEKPNTLFSSVDKGSIALSVGSKVEAMDFCGDWYKADIIEVDFDEMEVLVRYVTDTKRLDEWISVSSTRLRPEGTTALTVKPGPSSAESLSDTIPISAIKEELKEQKERAEEKAKLTYAVGERCLARWRDNRRFVATVLKDVGDDSYEIVFDDGCHWKCKASRLCKMKPDKGVSSDASQTALGPSNAPAPLPAYHTHLFDPARDYLGSKSERRERKRKLNIKEIFNIGQKKQKTQRKVKPKVKKIKTEIKQELPGAVDAVASIIGSVNIEQLDPKIEIKTEPDVLNDDNTSIDENTEIIEVPMTTCDSEDEVESRMDLDTVLEEESKLEKFEKPENHHEEVIDRIKEAIIKLEDGLNQAERMSSPKLEKIEVPIQVTEEKPKIEEQDTKDNINEPEKDEAIEKIEETIDVQAQLAAEMEKIGVIEISKEEINDTKPTEITETNYKVDNMKDLTIVLEKMKENPPEKDTKNLTKVKKSKKLRLIREKKVKKQVAKVKSELEAMKRQVEEMRKQMLMKSQEGDKGMMPESFLLPGEWSCKWMNGQPVGKVSEIEADGKPDPVTGKMPLPRRSVEVEDKRLPEGWTKHMVRRSLGNSAGKWDVVLVSPDNKRFHTKHEMRIYLENNPNLHPFETSLLDFGIHLKLARRMGWITRTSDGETIGPTSPLPVGTLCSTSPLVKRKSLGLKKNVMVKKRKIKKKKKIRMGMEVPEQGFPMDTDIDINAPPLEDGYVYCGSLKVQIIETLLRCPAEGCLKNFRNTTLLQMHIKHYHRELIKMMGATPKVLDLAYARSKIARPSIDTPKPDRTIKVKISRPKPLEPKPDRETKTEIEPSVPVRLIPRSQDSPKLRKVLNKPIKRPKVLLPVARADPNQIIPDLEEFEETEAFDLPMESLDFETAISTHTVTKPIFDKKKKKCFALAASEEDEWMGISSDVDTRSSFPGSGTPDSKVDKPAPVLSEFIEEKDNVFTYNESGERIKIVHMKREEIINCHCGFREEDGLMVQCELCLCWQHALCHNIQKEGDVPEKYTCSICLNPRRGRRSMRFVHDQDRLYEGLLPAAKPCESLRRSHELAANLLRLEDATHALRLKCYVAAKKDHPKLYLWAKDWEQVEIQYTQEKLNSDYSDLNIMINSIGKENLPLKSDDVMDIRTPLSEELEQDRYTHREGPLGSQVLLSSILSSPGGVSLDLPISTSELERLAKSVQEQELERQVIMAPQPEAAIEDSACRERLLRHVTRCQALVDARLDSIEAQVAELESQDPSLQDDETADFYPRTKQTIQMLMRDLDTMEELGVIT